MSDQRPGVKDAGAVTISMSAGVTPRRTSLGLLLPAPGPEKPFPSLGKIAVSLD